MKSGLSTGTAAEDCPTTGSPRNLLTRARSNWDTPVWEGAVHDSTRGEKRDCPRLVRDAARGLTEEIERPNGPGGDCTAKAVEARGGDVTMVTTVFPIVKRRGSGRCDFWH
eukprot:431902-Rhodomonas_salina.1